MAMIHKPHLSYRSNLPSKRRLLYFVAHFISHGSAINDDLTSLSAPLKSPANPASAAGRQEPVAKPSARGMRFDRRSGSIRLAKISPAQTVSRAMPFCESSPPDL
jgi:hypothetical protein